MPALWLLDRAAKRAGEIPEQRESLLTVPLPDRDGIKFFDRAIVVANGGNVAVFSAACPHLGCGIDRADNGEMVCRCHGSRFNARGERIQGPAGRGLRPLPFEADTAAGVLHIRLKT